MIALLGVEVHPLLDWGIPLLRWFNQLPASLEPLFDAASFLGSIEALTIVAATVLWSVSTSLGWRTVVVLLVYGALNTPMKVAFGLPRPYWVLEGITARAAETSYGLPSGHTGFAMAVYGRLAAGLHRHHRWAWPAGAALVATIGASRMYLGVHWPTDVLGGLAAGGLVVLVAVWLEPRITAWVRIQSLAPAIAVVGAASVVLLTVVIAAAVVTSGDPVPQAWSQLAATATPGAEPIDPRALDGPIGSTGALFGFGAGWLLLRRQGGYDAGGSLGQRLARLPIGLAGAAVLFGGVGVEPSGSSSTLALALTWLQFVAAGAWMGWGAPSLFVRTGLADRPAPMETAEPPEDHHGAG